MEFSFPPQTFIDFKAGISKLLCVTSFSVFSPPTQDGVEHLFTHLSPILTIPSIKRETEARKGSEFLPSSCT